MKSRYTIAVGAVALAVCGLALAQNDKIPPLTPKVPASPLPTPPALTPQPLPEAKPDDLTIEQLVDAVDKFREQKAEIEKKEKAYMKALQKKADKLKQKIDSLNGTPEAPPVISSTSAPQGIPVPGAPAFPPAPTP